MIPFFIGAIVGGFVGMTATAMCVAANDRTASACAEAYIADRYGSWQAAQEHWEEYGWY